MVLVAVTCATALAQNDFHRGKTIRIVVGYSAAGGFDPTLERSRATSPSTSPASRR
jgi:hypothetical protein